MSPEQQVASPGARAGENRCTQHSATGFDESRYVRLMHRKTLEGDGPIMAETAAAA